MILNDKSLKSDERAIFALRSLYDKYGYSQYKMSKFEEYDLYVRNKDFLISPSVITFTDTDGRLMALKPDVTLSIIKNCHDIEGAVQKMYYNENVYRPGGSGTFREIMQVGLECIGDIDGYSVLEVVLLAAKSLESISEEWVLDISHLGVVSEIIGRLELSDGDVRKVLKCVSEKNVHGIGEICGDSDAAKALRTLVSTYGEPKKVIETLRTLSVSECCIKELSEIAEEIASRGLSGNVRIDFSVTDDIKYYNGIVFRGFINGVSQSVLSGGRYDNLLARMGKSFGAIGFAVYLDRLEELSSNEEKYDVDTLILYDEGENAGNVSRAVSRIAETGASVSAMRKIPEKFRYKKLLKLSGSEVTQLENNA
ncbi:MAG: ATP phosphoribosyltransferase regulatory subunit [Oscillospiraceae bacterium]|nr:ATP phosphoribosyltransferase regulatory subunit [Oscillospiraceae bacterium]